MDRWPLASSDSARTLLAWCARKRSPWIGVAGLAAVAALAVAFWPRAAAPPPPPRPAVVVVPEPAPPPPVVVVEAPPPEPVKPKAVVRKPTKARKTAKAATPPTDDAALKPFHAD